MTTIEALQQHRQLCDDLHECALEENRFLRQHQRPLSAEFVERKRGLLARLDSSLEALRSVPAGRVRDPAARELLESTRGRILQIIQLDKENEALLLRYSLAGPKVTGAMPSPSATLLQKIYARIS